MSKNKIEKVMNSKDVLVVAFGAMIGWGWVVSSGEWILKAGVLGTVIGFIIGGIMIYFVGLTYAELSTAMPENGGCQVFSYRAFGNFASFICTWAMILSYVGVVCFEACSFPTIVQYIFPGFLQGYLYTIGGFDIYLSWLVVAILCAIFITFVNIKGVKVATFFQTVFTFVIGGVGILLIVMSAIKGNPANLFNQMFLGNSNLLKFENVLAISVVAPFFLFGFDVIPQVAEEINVPLKKMGKLLILSIVLAVMFYALVVIAVGYSLNYEEIFNSNNISGMVTADAMAKVFNSTVMAKILIVGGLCGIITSWNSFLLGGSRAIYSLSKNRMLPTCFSKLHPKYKTPVNALVLVGILSIISPFFGRKMLVWISNTASFSCCLTYFIVALAFFKLRKNDPDLNRPFKVKNYKLISFMAILLSGGMMALYLLPRSGSTFEIHEWFILILWFSLGLIFYFLCKIKKR